MRGGGIANAKPKYPPETGEIWKVRTLKGCPNMLINPLQLKKNHLNVFQLNFNLVPYSGIIIIIIPVNIANVYKCLVNP